MLAQLTSFERELGRLAFADRLGQWALGGVQQRHRLFSLLGAHRRFVRLGWSCGGDETNQKKVVSEEGTASLSSPLSQRTCPFDS